MSGRELTAVMQEELQHVYERSRVNALAYVPKGTATALVRRGLIEVRRTKDYDGYMITIAGHAALARRGNS